MIIDSHVHWWPSDQYVLPRAVWESTIGFINRAYYVDSGVTITNDRLEELFFDSAGEKLLGDMEEAGVDRSVLLPLDWEISGNEPVKGIFEQNRLYGELAKAHSDKLTAFYAIHPGREKASGHFLSAVKGWGAAGLKLYPPMGFFPDDGVCAPLYKVCLDHGLPVVFHGTTSPMSKIPYCHPEGFERLAAKFPGLKIVIAHMGGTDWFKEAVAACGRHENIYLDISSWQLAAKTGRFGDTMRMLLDSLGSLERVMFGSDGPIFNSLRSLKEWVGDVQGLDIPDKEKDNLLTGAAQRLLG